MTKGISNGINGGGRYEDRLSSALAAFTFTYGQDDTKLGKWQLLCDDCGVERGASITKCKAALRTVAINIWDLVKARQNDDLPVNRYKSKADLHRDLANNRNRRFPLRKVKASEENKLLRALLVTIN